MATLVKFPLASGGFVVVEVEDDKAGPVPAGRKPGEVAREVASTFEAALVGIRPAAEAIARELKALKPDELSIELGLKMTAEAGAIIAKAGAEANFKVTMKWDLASAIGHGAVPDP